MPEYIEREAAIRAVVDAVDSGLATTSEDLAEVIGDMPAADVVPVVRCMYCIHCERRPEFNSVLFCRLLHEFVCHDGFCVAGKRQLGGGDRDA